MVHILNKLFNLIKQITQIFYYYKYPSGKKKRNYFALKYIAITRLGENGEIKVTLDSTKK
jgi:hypothetical protein